MANNPARTKPITPKREPQTNKPVPIHNLFGGSVPILIGGWAYMCVTPTTYLQFDFWSATVAALIYAFKASYDPSDKSLLFGLIGFLCIGFTIYSFGHRTFTFPNHYKDQLEKIYNEGIGLKSGPKRHDGGGGVNVDLYPELKKWRKDLSKKLPKVYVQYFIREEDTDKYYLQKTYGTGFIPSNNGEEGDLYQSTFALLEWLIAKQSY